MGVRRSEVTSRTFFDALAPIDVSYSPSVISPYALDLTSLINMKVRGYGYHSETGEIRSGYALAAYVSNFVCDGAAGAAVAVAPEGAGRTGCDAAVDGRGPGADLQVCCVGSDARANAGVKH
jgi:hypothetical protein